MTNSSMKRIGIAVVEHAGCYLVGTRGPDVPLAGYAEFPGGKCLPDESEAACAIRECEEETQLAITIDRLLLRHEYSYPHATVDLHFFLCHPASQASVQEVHCGFQWIPARELDRLKFPEANGLLVKMLMSQ
jgi:8-oxo-dGTP diphosphatase